MDRGAPCRRYAWPWLPADIAKGANDPFFHALEAAEIDVAVVVLQHLHDLLAGWDAVHE